MIAAAALAVSCAAIVVCGYQLYWLRRLMAANRELRRLRDERAAETEAR